MKLHFSLLSFLIACGGESVIEKQQNTAPVIMIGSHSPDAEILEGYAETFRASVSDDNNTFEELTVAWYVGDRLVCDWETASPSGESFCDITFDAEDSNIIAEVRDPDGAGGRTELGLVIVPTEAPTAEILTPIQTTNLYSDQLIEFSGFVGDNEDNPSDLLVTWTSSVDGELILDTAPDANGLVSDYGYLTEGQHALELRVEDTSGKVTKEQIVVQVGSANAIPQCAISEPLDQTAVLAGDSVLFRGTATDENVPSTELDVQFLSDKDGLLGNGIVNSNGVVNFTSNSLSTNDHIISMVVTDEVGATCQDTILVYVGTAPSINIEEPLSGDVFSVGQEVFFHGTTSDTEDQMSDLAIVWNSSSLGELTAGTPDSSGSHQFSTDALTAGMHTITFSSTDSTGLVSTDTVTIQINTPPNAPSLTLSPDPVTGADVLTVNITSGGDDDGDPVSHAVEWFKNGVLQANTGNAVPSTDLSIGDIWLARVTPNDGYTDGTPTEISIVVSNSLPTITTPVISSSAGSVYNDSTLTCSATAFDTDETVTPVYTWDVNGNVVTGNTINLSNYSVGYNDTITCSVSVSDSNGGSANDQVSTTVDNRVPTISSLAITPNSPSTLDTLACVATTSDLDGDTLVETYEWTYNGQIVGTSSTLDLTTLSSATGDVFACEMSVTDPHGATANSSASTTVVNSPPIFDTPATITPSTVEIGTFVTCSSVVSDPDDGVASLTYVWNINGSQISTGSTWTVNSTDASVGDSISCTAVAIDYSGNTTVSASTPLLVSNTVPTVSNVALDNTSPYTNDSITVSGTTFDFNGDSVTLQYEWHVVDASQGGQDLIVYAGSGTTFATLDGSQSYGFDRDDEVYVKVTPNDGNDNGASIESDHAIVLNSAPTAPTVSVTSSVTPPLEGVDDLTCMITTVSTDPDGDSIDYTFNWYDENGSVTQTLANTTNTVDIFPGTQTTPGLWECDVTASDGSLTSNDFGDIEIDADWDGPLNFTNCGQTGTAGPSQSQCDTEYTGTTLDGLITLSSGIQQWVVPSTGTYEIEAAGAKGGEVPGYASTRGGYGATMYGTFDLVAGDVVNIVVGQMGSDEINTGNGGGGGGGGSFVYTGAVSGNGLLIAAGGGAGECEDNACNGPDAPTGTNASNACNSGVGYGGGSSGGGGGGAGWLSVGATSTAGSGTSNGGGHWDGGNSGGGGSDNDGGFGGGGSANNNESGGGGGYTGGCGSANRGASVGAGGSYNAGGNQSNTAGNNTGHGYVTINKL